MMLTHGSAVNRLIIDPPLALVAPWAAFHGGLRCAELNILLLDPSSLEACSPSACGC
jgi:hypothetical protein